MFLLAQDDSATGLRELAVQLRAWWEQLGDYEFPWQQWLIAAAIFVAVLLVLRVVKAIVGSRFRKLGEKPSVDYADLVADLLAGTWFLFLVVISAYAASFALALTERTRTIIESATIVALLIQAGFWGNTAAHFFVALYKDRNQDADAGKLTIISAVGVLARVVIFSIILLVMLDNVGVDVTAMVAGLGIGGIAIALAAQNILGDLFASASIVVDKPFVIGDFVIVGDMMGTIEHIGMKTTRVRSLSGEQLIFTNSDILSSRIRNFGRMRERRVVFSVGVTYDTPYDKVAGIPGMIRRAIEAQEQIRFDRAHFKSYGDSSLDFEVVYYVLSPDYALYMDIQQAVNLHVFQQFAEAGIEFAFPTRTIHIESGGENLAS